MCKNAFHIALDDSFKYYSVPISNKTVEKIFPGPNFAYQWPFIRAKTHILDSTEFYLIVRNVL